MTTLRQRQKNGWDIVLHHDSLLKQLTERRMKEKKKPDRPMEMLLDWLTNKEYKMDYSQLKRKIEDRTEWRRLTQYLPMTEYITHK